MPLSSLGGDNPLATDQRALSSLAGPSEVSPFPSTGSDLGTLSGLSNAPQTAPAADQGLEAMFGSSYAPASAPAQNRPDISGNIQEPSIWKLIFPGAFGGPAGVEFQYQKQINEKARPVASMILQEFSKSLNAGNYDRSNEAILGMSQLASKAPQFGKVVDSMTAELNKRRTNTEQNNSYLDVVAATGKDNPDIMQAVGALRTKASVMPMEATQKLVEANFPQIAVNNGYITKVNKMTAKGEVTTTPVMSDVKDFTPEEKVQLRLGGVDPVSFTELRNKFAVGKANMEDFQQFQQMQGALQQRLGVAEANKFIPFAERLKTGMEPPEALQQTGVPGAGGMQPQGMQTPGMQPQGTQNAPAAASPGQQQMQALTGQVAQHMGFSPQEAVAFQGIIAQESSMGKNLVGDGGKSIGPGHVQQAALDDFNKKFSTNVTMDDLKKSPELATYVSAGYFKQKLEQNPGNLSKAVEAYNGGGDKNYVSNVQKRIQELTGQGQTGMQKLVGQRQQIEASLKGAEVTAQETAKKQTEPTNQASTYWQINDKGMPVEYQGRRLSVDEAQDKGLYKAQDATEEKTLRDFRGRFEQGQRAFELIKAMPEDVLSSSTNLKKIFNYVSATGVSIPFRIPLFAGGAGALTIPGLGAVTLTQKEASAYNLLVGTAQNVVEPFLNKGNADNESVKAVKSAVYGAFANKDSALTTIKSALEQGWTDTIGRMKSAQGSGAETASPPQLNFTPSSQGGAAETLSGKYSQPLSENMSPSNVAQYLLKDVADLPKNITYLAEHPDTRKVLKDAITFLPKVIGEKVQGMLDAYLKWNREGEARIKAAKERQKQGPIAPSVLQGLGTP